MKLRCTALLIAGIFPAIASALDTSDLGSATFEEVIAQPIAIAGTRIPYGNAPEQYGILRIPRDARVTHPVVILIHGGCWLADYDLAYMEPLAAALASQGYATWNIEFRRLGSSGGGWPGTFSDIQNANRFLSTLQSKYHLDLGKTAIIGHSSGGQLALWLGKENSSAQSATPRPRILVSLAGITDLRQYRVGPEGSCHASVDELLGGSPERVADRYAMASPIERLPLGINQFIMQGKRDPIVSPASVRHYVEAARKAGDHVQLLNVEGGHFDVVMTDSIAFKALLQALKTTLEPSK